MKTSTGMKFGAPAQARQQGQLLVGVVGVLNVEAGNRTAQRVLLHLALLEGVLCSHEEIKVGISDGSSSVGTARAVNATEAEDAIGLVCVGDVELILNPLTTEDDLVLAAEHGDIVTDDQGVVVEMGDRVCAAAYDEFCTSRGQLQAVWLALVDIDPESGGVDVLAGISAVVTAPHDGEVRCIHRPAADGERVSEGEGLHAL